jgi:hypothetical protein
MRDVRTCTPTKPCRINIGKQAKIAIIKLHVVQTNYMYTYMYIQYVVNGLSNHVYCIMVVSELYTNGICL